MNHTLPTNEFANERTQVSECDMISYFLGKLSPKNEQQFEELFFADDQLFDRLQAVKEKLIDDYLHGKLAGEEFALFEQNFLSSPSLRKQVEFAYSLMASISNKS